MVDLTTLAAVKLWLKTPSGDTSSDALLQQLITAYSEFVRSWTNRDFDVRQYTITRSGNFNSAMRVPQYPIISIDSLGIDGQPVTAQSRFGAQGFRFGDASIYLDGMSFGVGQGNVTVTYTAGYPVIPADISQAVVELVASQFTRADRIGYNSKSLAGEVVSFDTRDVPATVMTVLKMYQNILP
jgi:hypothetical protein